MKNKAIQFYRDGWNCSQCMLKSIEYRFQIPISEECLAMCSAVNTGFGVGGMCSVLIACVMALGLLFDEADAKRLRIQFLSEFRAKNKSLNCSELINDRGKNGDCGRVVGEAAEILERLIEKEYYQ